jgi:hypothetical protein
MRELRVVQFQDFLAQPLDCFFAVNTNAWCITWGNCLFSGTAMSEEKEVLSFDSSNMLNFKILTI